MLHELGQRDPSRRVHMLVVLVVDELLIYGVGLDTLCAEPIDRVRHTKGGEERGGRTFVKAIGRNRAGTVRRNLRCVCQRSLRQLTSV